MNASHQPLVRVENLLRCWGGSAVDSIALVISDSPMLLSLLQHNAGADDYMPLELLSELTFEPPGIKLYGDFNRASGYRLRETLKESIGTQWHWLPPRHRRHYAYCPKTGRVIIPVQRLWFTWDDAEPHRAVSVRRRHLPSLRRDRSDTRLSKQERSDGPEGCGRVVAGE